MSAASVHGSALAGRLAGIVRYPVKGLSGERLDAVDLVPGEGLPDDRRFALAHGASAFDPDAPGWLPKSNFLCLAKNEKLATLATAYEADATTLVVQRDGRQVARGNLSQPTGRLVIQQFFEAYLGAEAFGRVRVVEAPGHMFSDIKEKGVSIINLASVADLERVTQASVDVRRFRGNLVLDGLPAWKEFDLIGRTLSIGTARLRIVERIDRCAATTVNPDTGERDLQVPRALVRGYGHCDCGVHARVEIAGRIAAGDPWTIID